MVEKKTQSRPLPDAARAHVHVLTELQALLSRTSVGGSLWRHRVSADDVVMIAKEIGYARASACACIEREYPDLTGKDYSFTSGTVFTEGL